MHLQKLLQHTNETKRKTMPEPQASEEIPDLTSLQFACRRLMDSLADTGLWQLAKDDGVPLALSQTSFPAFYNFRQQFFSRQKKRGEEYFRRYGGLANLYAHGKANGWKDMLLELERAKVAVRKDVDGKTFFRLVFTAHGAQALGEWKVSEKADDLYTSTAPPWSLCWPPGHWHSGTKERICIRESKGWAVSPFSRQGAQCIIPFSLKIWKSVASSCKPTCPPHSCRRIPFTSCCCSHGGFSAGFSTHTTH